MYTASRRGAHNMKRAPTRDRVVCVSQLAMMDTDSQVAVHNIARPINSR